MARPGTVCPHNKVLWAGLCRACAGTWFKMTGTGTPSRVTGVLGVPFSWACRAGRTVAARPGQSLSLIISVAQTYATFAALGLQAALQHATRVPSG